MKKIKIILIIFIMIVSFLSSFMGAAQARSFYFFGAIPGLINSPAKSPFDSGTSYTSNVSISAISDVALSNDNQEIITITLTTSNGTDLSTVDLFYEVNNDGIIENIALTGTGSTKL